MLVSRANLTAHVAAKDMGRPALTGICLDSTGATSADGFVLLHTPYPQANPDDYPALGHDSAAWVLDKPVLIPAEAAARFVKANKPPSICRRGQLPILQNVAVSATSNGRDNSHVRLGVTDLESEQSVSIPTIDATYPNHAAMVWTTPAHFVATLNIERLIPLLQALKLAGVTGARFSFQAEEGRSVKIEPAAWDTETLAGTVALIMPMNNGKR